MSEKTVTNPFTTPWSKTNTNPFSTPSSKSDLTLVVEDMKLHVSKLVLSLASPVFERMFEGDFKEKSCTDVHLPDKKYKDMVQFLLCVYPSTMEAITSQNLDAVLPLADEYQVKTLKRRCEDFVLAQFEKKDELYSIPNNVELVHFLFLADKYSLKKLLDVCIEKLHHRNYDVGKNAISKIPEFQQTSLDTTWQVLSKRLSAVETTIESIQRYLNGYGYFTIDVDNVQSKLKSILNLTFKC